MRDLTFYKHIGKKFGDFLLTRECRITGGTQPFTRQCTAQSSILFSVSSAEFQSFARSISKQSHQSVIGALGSSLSKQYDTHVQQSPTVSQHLLANIIVTLSVRLLFFFPLLITVNYCVCIGCTATQSVRILRFTVPHQEKEQAGTRTKRQSFRARVLFVQVKLHRYNSAEKAVCSRVTPMSDIP